MLLELIDGKHGERKALNRTVFWEQLTMQHIKVSDIMLCRGVFQNAKGGFLHQYI